MRLITAVALIATCLRSAALAAGGEDSWTSTTTCGTTTTNPYFAKPIPLRSYRDQSYAVGADVGTPPQRLYLSIDVFDGDMTVADSDCKECCHRARYDWRKSSTSKCEVKSWGTGTEYLWCKDTLRIGTLVSKDHVNFIDAILGPGGLNASAFARAPSAGTVGLAYLDSYWNGWTGDHTWGLYLKSTCTNDVEDNAGTLCAVHFDSDNCGDLVGVVPVEYGGDQVYAGLATLLSVYVPPSTDSFRGIEGRWTAAFSTTSSYIVIPETTFKPLNNYYWHVTEDKDTGDWIVDCAYDTAEELQFTFEGKPNASFTFNVRHFIDKVGAQCVLRIRPRRSDEDDALQERWVFGLPFFRKYCALFHNDFGSNPVISFAEQKGYKVPNCTYDAVRTLAPCTPATASTTTTAIPTPTTTKASSATYASSPLIAVLASFVSLSLKSK